MNIIKIAVIGLGYWGPNLVRNFYKIPGVKVTLVSDLKKENLNKIKLDFPALQITQNYKDILKNKEVDLVAIATPVKTHFKLAKEVLLAKKHVLVEKPMTKTSEEAKELIALAKEKNKILMVEHTFVYSQAVKKIKELISKKQLGNILYYDSLRINLGILQKDSNVIWDLAPHDLSILNYIFPEKPISLQVIGSSHINKTNEEMAHLYIKYQKNITAHIHVSWLSPLKIRTILIGGSKKMIVYDDIQPSEKIKIYDKGVSVNPSKITPFSPAYRHGDVIIPHLEQVETLYTELSHLVECVRYKKKPITSGEEGLKTVQLLEASDQALKTKSQISLYESKK